MFYTRMGNATVRQDKRCRMASEDPNWLYASHLPLFDDIEPSAEPYDPGLATERKRLAGLNEYTGSIEAEDHGSYPSVARKEQLIRYSAFWPDRRIAPDGSVGTGTYATTENDKTVVPSGLTAVGRYALPNPAPAGRIRGRSSGQSSCSAL